MAWRDFVNSLGYEVEGKMADTAYKKAAAEKALQDILDSKRKLEPRFSMANAMGTPIETPSQTQAALDEMFNKEYESPDARIAALDKGIKQKTADLSYQQKPVFNSPEFEKVTEGIKQLREQKAKEPKQGFHRIFDRKTGKLLREIPSTPGTGDTVNFAGESSSSGENREFRKDKAILDYSEKLENNYLIKAIKTQNLGLDTANELDNLVKSGNTVASAALGIKQAKGLGEVGVMTDSDVKKYVTSGKISQRVADNLLKWMKGKQTNATLDEILQMNSVMKEITTKKIQAISNTYVNRLARSFDMTPEEAAYALDVPYTGSFGSNKTEVTPPSGVGEIKRRTADGRVAVYDSNKNFLRYE